MKQYITDNIRNISIIGHGGTGKTTLTENMLYFTGAINKLGAVESGNTSSDFEDEEVKRKISILYISYVHRVSEYQNKYI